MTIHYHVTALDSDTLAQGTTSDVHGLGSIFSAENLGRWIERAKQVDPEYAESPVLDVTIQVKNDD
jgi:hypothetical protein